MFKIAIGLAAFAAVMMVSPSGLVSVGPTVTTAEARVGRPATPVSAAGVARRTVRRCAAGVYNC
jgi:hypothetical protein